MASLTIPVYQTLPTTHFGSVWQTWTTSSATSTSNTIVWESWCSGTTDAVPDNPLTYGDIRTVVYQYTHKELTEEEKEVERLAAEALEKARAEERKQARLRAEEDRRKREEAKERAQEFLRQLLDEKQMKDLIERDLFYVIDRLGRTWKILNKGSGNLHLVEDGKTIKRLCVVFQDYDIPLPDLLAAQKITLENNPELIEKVGILCT